MAKRRFPVLRWLGRGIAGFVLLTVLLVLPLRWLPPLTTSFMIQNWLKQASLSARVAYDWVPRSAISREAALAVMAGEDQKFLDHPGFDVDSIRTAIRKSRGGIPRRGASTISQQVAKNLWLWPGHSLVRKAIEAWFTVFIELFWPKERILEVYLNVAQFGPTVFGVEAASRTYFGRPASRIDRSEAALLAAVLPNPNRFLVQRPSPFVRGRQAWIAWQAGHLAPVLPAAGWYGSR